MPVSATPTAPTKLVVDFAVEIKTRDGVRLIADVYRPAGDDKWPVILQRNPYGRTDEGMGSMVIVDPAWLARQGYAVIVQDTRGRGESDGVWEGFHQDTDDGYDTVEWAASQPWSTGDVGMYGSSGMGITTYKAIAARPPSLRAAVAFISGPDLEVKSSGGLLQVSFMTWYALMMAIDTAKRLDSPSATADLIGRILNGMGNLQQAWETLPLNSIDGLDDSAVTPHWEEWLSDATESPLHKGVTLSKDPDVGDVALLQIGGYRDFIGPAQFALAEDLEDNPKHRFIAGPWTHRGPYSGATGARELPDTSTPAGPLGWGPLLAAWFDIHLRGGDGSAYPLGLAWLTGEPVRYYIEGQDTWAEAPSWPPASTARALHLTSQGDARSASGNGHLLLTGDGADSGADTFHADPHDPFPTCGGALGAPFQGPDGIQDQRAVDGRQDVLVYTSETLQNPLTVVGTSTVVLHLDSTAPDADILVTLVDVEPDGFAYNVSEGGLRTRYREGGTDSWLTPGTPTEITVQLHDTAHTFEPGHKIRIMIAGANFPQFSRNLHTKTVPELGSLDEAIAADHTVHHGKLTPSRLIVNEAS
nr:CocE/NonD family hydrolase [Rhodococcus sp. (in: high G+C Gram-positive bacteria)]